VKEGWVVFRLAVIALVLILGRVGFGKKPQSFRVEPWKEPKKDG
tara:strand:+ start:503 stop:634 length:132 start_codon:yes stop_codon:yes gene_type:complete